MKIEVAGFGIEIPNDMILRAAGEHLWNSETFRILTLEKSFVSKQMGSIGNSYLNQYLLANSYGESDIADTRKRREMRALFVAFYREKMKRIKGRLFEKIPFKVINSFDSGFALTGGR